MVLAPVETMAVGRTHPHTVAMTTVGERTAAGGPGRAGAAAPQRSQLPAEAFAPAPPPRARTSVTRLVYRFALAGVLAMFLVSLATGLVSHRIATDQAVSDARQVAWITGHGIVEPVVTDGLLTQDPAAIAAVDRVVRASVLHNALTRVKIWRPDGTIVYSDEPRLLGAQFDLGAPQLGVLRTNTTEASVSDLDEAENQYEPRNTRLLEVYLRIHTPDRHRLLYEAYFSYDGVAASGRSTWLSFAIPAIGALLVLELVQIPLAISLARRLRSGQEERERLLRRAVESSDAERRRIASDLHDGVVQNFTGVSYALTAEVLRPSEQHSEVLASSAGQVRDGITALRSLLVDIYPPNLQESGLESALSDLLGQLRSRGITADLVTDVDVVLDPDAVRLLYRVAQEAVRNVLTHAHASTVVVRLEQGPGQVRLSVEDDGRGIDPEALAACAGEGHVGLRLLAGLTADADGTLDVWSAPGAGTCVTATLPLS